ncbi:MAG TPA: GxxExxY protein [Anaerolineales bacterium]|nr:GxxExxY protein [Anaerolineales bacterium]
MLKSPKKNFQPIPAETERIGKVVLDAAFKVHTTLGPGLLESVYRVAIKHVIESGGTLAETEVKFPIMFEGVKLESGLRIDMLVANCVIAELKSVEKMHPVYEAQLMTYLRLTGVRLGFLINFNVPHLKDGIKRMVV